MRVIFIAVAIMLCGCYTQKKASWQTDKAIDKFPAIVAEKARLKWPCVIGVSDTVVTVKDSIVYIECPEVNIIDRTEKWNEMIDGIINSQPKPIVITKTIKVPVHLPVEVRTVTVKVKDSAATFVLSDEINKLKGQIIILDGKNDRKMLWVWWLLALLIISVLINIIQSKKRLL